MGEAVCGSPLGRRRAYSLPSFADRQTDLVWVTNLGDIEKHVLLARAPDIDCPTSLVFDLDPGEPADILDCGRVALHLNDVFQSLGLECFVEGIGLEGIARRCR